MVNKVSENPEIWQIQVELPKSPLKNLNSYVIVTEENSLVIDTGFNRPECERDLFNGLKEIGVDFNKTSLFITHCHGDHCGLAPNFEELGCQVYMGRKDYNYHAKFSSGEYREKIEEIYTSEGFPYAVILRQPEENQDRKYRPLRMFNASLVEDGDSLPLGNIKNQCIVTPGHSPGHMVLYLPEYEILFSGDHILFDITPNIGVWINERHSLSDYLESLEKIRNLPVKITLPAHRSTFQKDVYTRIEELKEHHRSRLQEIKDSLQKYGPSDAYSVAGHITWSSRGRCWDEMSPHLKWFAMGETLAHLYYLANEGSIDRVLNNGTYSYSVCADRTGREQCRSLT